MVPLGAAGADFGHRKDSGLRKERGSTMTFAPTALANRRDDLLIEDLDRSAPGTALFTWCIVQAPGTAR